MPTLPALPWKWIGALAGALAIIAAIYFSIQAYGQSRYDAGQSEERAVWEVAVAERQAALEELQRKADAALAAQRENDRAAIVQSRKELEDELASIPDQPTSDRQRARACAELLRSGQVAPACNADAPG